MERRITLTIVTSEDGKRCDEECEYLSDSQWCSLFAEQVVDRRVYTGTPRAALSVRADACLAAETSQPARGGA